MKTILTLNTGSFYFLSTVNLVRGIPVEVDLSNLTEGELKGIKAYVASGNINSSEDISNYEVRTEDHTDTQEAQPASEDVPPVEEKATEVTPEQEPPSSDEKEAVEAEPTTEDHKDYTKMFKKDLKAELDRRGIKTELTRNEDLIRLLKEDDAK